MRFLSFMAALLVATTANATLIDRGNGMIYDDVLNITWLANASEGAGSAFDDSFDTNDGFMTSASAIAWADDLIFGGYDDWRLPSMDVNGDHEFSIVDCSTATEMDCRDNELGYMFYYNLMGSLGDNLGGDQGLFTNILSSHWSGTEYAPFPVLTWFFNPGSGEQGIADDTFIAGAWAVRSGDVLAAPEPATALLLGLGLAGVGLARRRR